MLEWSGFKSNTAQNLFQNYQIRLYEVQILGLLPKMKEAKTILGPRNQIQALRSRLARGYGATLGMEYEHIPGASNVFRAWHSVFGGGRSCVIDSTIK